jgi:hypothetical protein
MLKTESYKYAAPPEQRPGEASMSLPFQLFYVHRNLTAGVNFIRPERPRSSSFFLTLDL